MTGRPSIAQIQRAVAKHFDVSVLDLKSNRQGRALCQARHVAVYMCRRLTMQSAGAIGHRFGDRDPGTIRLSLRMMEERLAASDALRAETSTLAATIAEACDAPPDLTVQCVFDALVACQNSLAEAEAALEEAQGILREQAVMLEGFVARMKRGADIGEIAA